MPKRYFAVVVLLSTCSCMLMAQVVTPNVAVTTNPVIAKFYQLSGWGQALTIQSAVATGTIDYGDGTGTHAITFKVRRDGRLRVDVPDMAVVSIATNYGASTITNGKRIDFSAAQGTQVAGTPIVPIFTPLVELASTNVLTSVFSSTAAQTTISVAKTWNIGDGADAQRSRSGLLQATFDNTTNLLQSISAKAAFEFDFGEIPPRRLIYGDYRQVGPILLPFAVKEYAGNQLISVIQFSSISVNVSLTDADFTVGAPQ